MEQSLLAESWNPSYAALGFDPDDTDPLFLMPAVNELVSTDASGWLENWLRRLAREQIAHHIALIGPRLQRAPGKVFVMDQRTKWGNCSALGNLSFNWRLVMAPDDVLRYIVTHELVHLAIPDHSTRFWLTVRSHCPGSERARQWLAANGHRLTVDLAERLAGENATDTP
ncbi:M48 family metallopeptidase [Thiocapsa sp. UBA6158]|uniref:M48 family metallopeptidase n=1 Tax=Thiocapsa sp. UBA6158 TaxID=1947692 RepID=UPI0025DD89D8|nr:M48 family metallopeptidase [Thiocapsa sp. UBA6158]